MTIHKTQEHPKINTPGKTTNKQNPLFLITNTLKPIKHQDKTRKVQEASEKPWENKSQQKNETSNNSEKNREN